MQIKAIAEQVYLEALHWILFWPFQVLYNIS